VAVQKNNLRRLLRTVEALSDLGPEPIVRLQTGGLKAAEVLWRHRAGERNVNLVYMDQISTSQVA